MVWKPNKSEIKKSEILGRRVYKSPVLDNDNRLRVDHFFDTRTENDLSVDRLGEGSVIKKVTVLVAKKAGDANPEQTFFGWAGLKAKSLTVPAKTALTLLATPKIDNDYHGDISREDFRKDAAAYSLAIRLRESSESDFDDLIYDGKISKPSNDNRRGRTTKKGILDVVALLLTNVKSVFLSKNTTTKSDVKIRD